MRVAEVADKFLEGPQQYPWKTLVEGILATLGSGGSLVGHLHPAVLRFHKSVQQLLYSKKEQAA